MHTHLGEGNGSPLQCSCLENPRDGGAWWAAVRGVRQSRTRLKWRSSSSRCRHTHSCNADNSPAGERVRPLTGGRTEAQRRSASVREPGRVPSLCRGVRPLNRMTREVLTDTVTFKQRPERREGAVWVESWEKRSWREAQLGVFWCVWETAWVLLEWVG